MHQVSVPPSHSHFLSPSHFYFRFFLSLNFDFFSLGSILRQVFSDVRKLPTTQSSILSAIWQKKPLPNQCTQKSMEIQFSSFVLGMCCKVAASTAKPWLLGEIQEQCSVPVSLWSPCSQKPINSFMCLCLNISYIICMLIH